MPHHLMNLRNYIVVTAAYWGFTLTDGALRMLVLLHFAQQGFSPVRLAMLFLFYEFFGIVTNLFGGWLASRMGLRVTLLAGLGLQVAALGLLGALNPAWTAGIALGYVMAAQALSGVAKDLTKMSSKSERTSSSGLVGRRRGVPNSAKSCSPMQALKGVRAHEAV
jgi:MFS family permease